MRTESEFKSYATSHVGAMGLTQLMPFTARWLDRGMTSPERIMQPEANLAAGFRYPRRLIDKYDAKAQIHYIGTSQSPPAIELKGISDRALTFSYEATASAFRFSFL